MTELSRAIRDRRITIFSALRLKELLVLSQFCFFCFALLVLSGHKTETSFSIHSLMLINYPLTTITLPILVPNIIQLNFLGVAYSIIYQLGFLDLLVNLDD